MAIVRGDGMVKRIGDGEIPQGNGVAKAAGAVVFFSNPCIHKILLRSFDAGWRDSGITVLCVEERSW